MSIEIIDSFGDNINVEPELGLYETRDFMGSKMPGLAIQLYSYDEDGFREPYATLTVNFGEFFSLKNCAYIDTNNNSFTSQLLDKGFCIDTGLTKHSGYCVYPLWKFDEDFLRSIDVNGLYDTYSKMFDRYIEKGDILPVEYREQEVLSDIVEALKCEGFEIDSSGDKIIAIINDVTLTGAEIYKYLLENVFDFNNDGSVEGLELEQNVDLRDLCEHHKVNYRDYAKKKLDKVINEAKAECDKGADNTGKDRGFEEREI